AACIGKEGAWAPSPTPPYANQGHPMPSSYYPSVEKAQQQPYPMRGSPYMMGSVHPNAVPAASSAGAAGPSAMPHDASYAHRLAPGGGKMAPQTYMPSRPSPYGRPPMPAQHPMQQQQQQMYAPGPYYSQQAHGSFPMGVGAPWGQEGQAKSGAAPQHRAHFQQRPAPTPPPSQPQLQQQELRLNLPIADGTILQPFRLDHALSVSHYQFDLRPEKYSTLMNRPDLELQLRAQLIDDRSGQCNWPKHLSVSINNQPVVIEKLNQPLNVKALCTTSRRNTLQIAVTACCCSHVFTLQLVHRPSFLSLIQGLWRRRCLPTSSCIEKIRQLFSESQGNNEVACIASMIVSLRCPINSERINLPARGSDCRHLQCFDLQAYLLMNMNRSTWRCPLCDRLAPYVGLEIDEFQFSILEETDSSVDQVIIDSRAHWRPVAAPAQADVLSSKPETQLPPLTSSQLPIRSPMPSNLSEPCTPQLPPMTPDFQNISGSFMSSQQPGTPLNACPPTNASCSTTDPASVRTDLDDINPEPLGPEPSSITELLAYLDSEAVQDLLG
ncbi:hypothetical protein BOX15_Mlig000228g7, partial [Macrostomum lignano]